MTVRLHQIATDQLALFRCLTFVLIVDPICGDTFEVWCDNKRQCLPMSKFCNGRIDCDDRSDEVNCRAYYCLNTSESNYI
jgi:Low-density lipoprotein receptor domain class A